jgi:hypothetical protein
MTTSTIDVSQILGLLNSDLINKCVLQVHDEARERFNAPSMIVRDHQEFLYIVQSYVQHHLEYVGEGQVSDSYAFEEARMILDRAFGQDQFQEGYTAALQQATDGADGGMRTILNEMADDIKRKALRAYMDHVYYHHVCVIDKRAHVELGQAFYDRFGDRLREYGVEIDEFTFAANPRAALEYLRQVMEQILGVQKAI